MTYWCGEVKDCQLCGSKLGTVMYDARTPRGWANIGHCCFRAYGLKLGTGYGQKYSKQQDGRWLKVAG